MKRVVSIIISILLILSFASTTAGARTGNKQTSADVTLFSVGKTKKKTTKVISDQTLIKRRIKSFCKAYNAGDMNGVLDCLDQRTRNACKATLDIVNAVVSEKTGIDIDLTDLFSISVGAISDEDLLRVGKIKTVAISEDSAQINAIMAFYSNIKSANSKEKVQILMKKEGSDWFIRDIVSRE